MGMFIKSLHVLSLFDKFLVILSYILYANTMGRGGEGGRKASLWILALHN